LLRAIDGYEGDEVVRCLLKLSPHFFLRPGELRLSKWNEFDLENNLWCIPASRMKIKSQDHFVPLSTQAMSILKDLHFLTGHREYLFPGPRDWKRPISNNTANAALRVMGFGKERMCMHGFRAIARTLLDEILHFRIDIVEHQLAHAVRDATGRAYNRTTHLPERIEMMQKWSDYLDELKSGKAVQSLGEVIQMKVKAVS
ncbi:MAG: site-specific integrase, partial [bacterium]